MKVIAVANQKGGVAKTATAGALATGLKLMGYSVLAVDMDPQANLSDSMGGEESEHTLYTILMGEDNINEAIQRDTICDLVPATIMLAGLEAELNCMGRELRLKEEIEAAELDSKYDYMILDTPPAMGIITINALVAADSVVIPTMADMASVKGIDQLNATIRNVRKYFNDKLGIDGILFTRHSSRTNIGRDIRAATEKIAENMGTRVYDAYIRASVVVPESNAMASDLWSYSPNSTVANDYSNFIEEFLKGVG